MAPEQRDPAAHPGALGPPADVYGLGATLYHAVAGERAPAPLPRRTPQPLAAVLEAALAADPAARPTAAQIAAGLEPLVAALPQRLTLGRH
jgi:eukaryotic-like serine/threonine-protein kinase